MPITDFPFLCLTRDNKERPWLPVTIINPKNGKSIKTYGLVDTGADECSVPAGFAKELGHDLRKGNLKKVDTAGGKTKAYSHVTTIEIFNIKENKAAHRMKDIPIDFADGLNVVLLGVKDFLDHFTLKIDYPKKVFSIKASNSLRSGS